jgi:hypothetical protein
MRQSLQLEIKVEMGVIQMVMVELMGRVAQPQLKVSVRQVEGY